MTIVSNPTHREQRTSEVADDEGIASSLRVATLGEHRAAEQRSFMVDLLGGGLSLAHYTRYLAQFAWVYEQLEARAPHQLDPGIFDPALARLASIESDLRALSVVDRRQEHPALPSTLSYVRHLENIPATDTERWVAHHYTRYLGDLSGGQAIARLVARNYGATPEQLTFYEFPGIANLVSYKRAYREMLDGLGLSSAGRDILIAEVRVAYRLNSALFDELGSS